MFAKGQNIIQIFEQLAPKYLAEADDQIGLQVGSLNKEIKKIMLTLDILENVVDEAIDKEIDLIIAHHPLIYKPLKNLRTDLPHGRILEKLLKNNLAVYVAHSNLDAAAGGVNDAIAKQLGLNAIDFLMESYTEPLEKLVVFVPASHHQQMIEALSLNGAGQIGNYSHCTFNIFGKGTFMPLAGSNPYIGTENKLEQVNEVRIETIIPLIKQKQVIQAMLKAHPYEEVAYDIYPLELSGNVFGIGRLGKLDSPTSLKDYADFVKNSLRLDGVRVVGELEKKVKKVAIAGGDGNKLVSKAIFQGADVLLTGDIYYHVAHEAMAQGLAIIDIGHNIEKLVLNNVKSFLQQEFIKKNILTELIISETNTNPFQFR